MFLSPFHLLYPPEGPFVTRRIKKVDGPKPVKRSLQRLALEHLLERADIVLGKLPDGLLVRLGGGVVHAADPESGIPGGLDGVEGVLKHHGALLGGAKPPQAPLIDRRAFTFAGTNLAAGHQAPEVAVDAGVLQGGLRQRALRDGVYINKDTRSLQQGKK